MADMPLKALVIPLLLAGLLPASGLGAALDDIDLTAPEARNLAGLVALFQERRGVLGGELAEVAGRLEAAPSAPAARQLLRQLLPELARHRATGVAAAPRASARQVSGRARQRPLDAAGASARGHGFANAVTWLTSIEPASAAPRTTLWLEGSHSSAEQDDRDGIDGFDSDASGMMLGLSRELAPGFSLGIAGGRRSADITTPGRGRDDSDSEDYLAFSTLSLGAHRLDLLVSARITASDRQRRLFIPGDGAVRRIVVSSDVDTEQRLLSAGWSYDLEFDDGWYLTPGIALSHTELKTDDYLERGGGELGLRVTTEDEQQWRASASVGFGRLLLAGAWAMAPSAFVSVEHALQADDTVTSATFSGTRFGFTARGYSVDKTRLSGGLSLAAYHLSGFGASISVAHESQDDYRDTTLSGTLELTF